MGSVLQYGPKLGYTISIIMSLGFQVSSTVIFHHRNFHASMVIGKYLYIDGGEVTTWNGSGSGVQEGAGVQSWINACLGGGTCEGNITTLPENSTLAIDLSESWSNTTVKLSPIEKTALVLNSEVLWQDVTNDSFYAYDGGVSWAVSVPENAPDNSLWQFIPSESSGTWSQVPLTQQSTNFTSLVRTVGGASTSGHGLGFVLGGEQNGQTAGTSIFGAVPVPGLLMYNSSSQVWYNISALGYSNDGTSINGAAQFVSSFGPNGLLLVIGGTVSALAYSPTLLSTDTISLYDPLSGVWKTQAVTGAVPRPRGNACVVGAQGDNGTYEVFMYGGYVNGDIDLSIELDTVYVLSLPAFNWEKSSYQPQYSRQGHTCNVINRQMIAVGGVVQTAEAFNTSNDTSVYLSNVDPWDQGLGVFDLTDLAWKDAFNASAGPYITPEVVKNYYAHNPRYPPSLLKDPVLRAWFTGEASKSNSSNSTTSPISTNSTSNPPSNRHTTNTGAISGGTVAGVVVLLVLAVSIFVFLRRRQRRQRQHGQGRQSAFEKPELDNTHVLLEHPKPELRSSRSVVGLEASQDQSEPYEMHDEVPMQELDGHRNISEMPNRSRVEMAP